MESNKEKELSEIKNELIENGIDCGNIEYTSGNYTNDGKEILEMIPTITCELGEIGVINNLLYLTIIFPVQSLSEELFNIVKKYKSVNIYPFINFKKTLYPSKTNDLKYVKQGLIDEKFFQINIEFGLDDSSRSIQKLRRELIEKKIEYINQLKDSNLLKQK